MTHELPTPDQQRATAERYQGQRARQVYEPTEIPRSAGAGTSATGEGEGRLEAHPLAVAGPDDR